MAKARDRTVDDVWINRLDRLGPDAEAVGNTRPKILKHHVRPFAQFEICFDRLGFLEVERDTALRAVDRCGEGRELAAFDER